MQTGRIISQAQHTSLSRGKEFHKGHTGDGKYKEKVIDVLVQTWFWYHKLQRALGDIAVILPKPEGEALFLAA